jgi:hypothetical protein
MYFVTGMAIITWWSLYSPLKRSSFNHIKVSLIFYSALHFLILYLYQIPIVQHYIDYTSFIARLMGLNSLVTNDCDTYWHVDFTPATWTQYSNFFLIVAFYHILIVQYSWTKHGIRTVSRDSDSSVHEEV